MILKEAFRYQNFYDSILEKIEMYLYGPENVYKITEEHLRKEANPEAENSSKETIKRENELAEPNLVIDFYMDVIKEKEKLTRAISEAKRNTVADIDVIIATNKAKQRAVRCMTALSCLKPSERLRKETAFKLNVNGEQVPYEYDVREERLIDFDRKKVRAYAKKFQKETDERSTIVDRLNVSLEVEYVSPYEIGDTLEECVEKWCHANIASTE